MTPGAEPTKSSRTETSRRAIKGERLVLLAVTLGIVLAPLNSTMIAVALPAIIVDFGAGVSGAGWLITAYLIAMASLQPLTGKLGDRLGHRAMVLTGLALFGFACAGAALSPALPWLLVFRIFQATCAALIVPNGSALLREVLPENRRGSGFGLMGAGIAIAAAAGPPLAGILVEVAGWRAIFYVNLLIVMPSLFIGIKHLPSVKTVSSGRNFDSYGAMLMAALLLATAWIIISISISISEGGDVWLLGLGIPLVLGGAAVLGWYEKRQQDPILQLNLLVNRSFSAAAAGIGFGNLAMYSLLVSIPLLLASRNDSSLRIGLVLATMSAGMTIASFVGGRLIDGIGRRIPTTFGLVLLAIGVLPVTLSGSDVSIPLLIAGLTLVGLGLGLAIPGLQTAAVEAVNQDQLGSAAGVYSTSRYLGSIVGSAVIAGVLGADQANINGLGLVFWICFIAAAIAALSSLGLVARPTRPF